MQAGHAYHTFLMFVLHHVATLQVVWGAGTVQLPEVPDGVVSVDYKT
jgi:hypothetical protein